MKRFVLSIICLLSVAFIDAASLKRGEQNVQETIDAVKSKLVDLETELDLFSQFLVQAIEAHESVDAIDSQVEDDSNPQVQPLPANPEENEPQPLVQEEQNKRDFASVRERYLAVEDTKEMAAFKRSLSTDDQALLKMYISKSRFIQAILAEKRVKSKKSLDEHPHIKRQTALDDSDLQDYIAQLPADQQKLFADHPSEIENLREAILRPGATGEAQAAAEGKRGLQVQAPGKRQTDLAPELEEFISQLSAEQQKLIRDHPSLAEPLVEAIHRTGATGEEQQVETGKRGVKEVQVHNKRQSSFSPEVEAFIATLSADQQKLVRDHPSKAEELLIAINRPKATGEEIAVETGRRGVKEVQVHNKRQSLFAPEVEAFIATLPSDQQKLIRDHPSEAGELLAAINRPKATGEELGIDAVPDQTDVVAKRILHEGDYEKLIEESLIHINALKLAVDTAAELQSLETADPIKALTDKILADIQLAKQKGIKLEDLLKALKDRNAATTTTPATTA